MLRFVLLLAALVASLGLPPVAHGQGAAREPRLALVIANGNYRGFDRLSATFDDGERISAALTATGFVDGSGSGAVRTRRDLTAAQMEAEIAAFRAALAAAGPDAFGVLYFSGHGVALGAGGDVQMVPVDSGKGDLAASGNLSRSAVTRTLMASGARNVLVVLDMCRNVIALPTLPVATDDNVTSGAGIEVTGSKGLKRVLRSAQNPIRPDQGYLVAFSTSADQFAFDNGIFSKVLAEEIRRPQQNIADAMKRVSDRVAMAKAASFQKPTFDYGLQGQPPCFVSCDPASGNRFYDCANCPWMRIVPAGSALVGSPPSEPGRGKDEPAQQRVTIARDFALGVYEVTVAEWTACVRDGACPKLSTWAADNPNPLIPATSISHDDALVFLGWLSRQSGRAYIACRPMPNGNMRAGQGPRAPFPGATVSRLPTPITIIPRATRALRPRPIAAIPRRCRAIRPTASACTRCRAMSGNGPRPVSIPLAATGRCAADRSRACRANCDRPTASAWLEPSGATMSACESRAIWKPMRAGAEGCAGGY